MNFFGKHYETGTLANALQALGATDPKTGQPYSEALTLGASGGIAFGYFVFEYKGRLPHVALLPRNTFAPFERALDNLGIRREVRESTNDRKGQENLLRELDCGNPVIVWADYCSLPDRKAEGECLWLMLPLLVVGHEGTDYLVVDGPGPAKPMPKEVLEGARGKVKKDRYRIMVVERPEADRIPEGLLEGIRTCASLFLDKPPAGSANNFGITGMRFWAKMLVEKRNAKSWNRVFPPGPNLVQALAGRLGQPGVWDWITTWGTENAADRLTYAKFLREAIAWTGLKDLEAVAAALDGSAREWRELANETLPEDVPILAEIKAAKVRLSECPCPETKQRLIELTAKAAVCPDLAEHAMPLQAAMSERVLLIADIEEAAMRQLREILH